MSKSYVVDELELVARVGANGTAATLRIMGYCVDDAGNTEHMDALDISSPSAPLDINQLSVYVKRKLEAMDSSLEFSENDGMFLYEGADDELQAISTAIEALSHV